MQISNVLNFETHNTLSFELPDYPILVGIPVTNKCNSDCSYCLRQNIPSRFLKVKEDLSIDHVKYLASVLRGKVPYINISAGYGECLLHPNIESIISLLSDANIKIIGYTNGKETEKLKAYASGFSRCVISTSKQNFDSRLVDCLCKISNTDNLYVSLIIDLPENDLPFLESVCSFCLQRGITVEFHWLFNYNNIKRKPTSLALSEMAHIKERYHNVFMEPTITYNTIHCSDPWRALYFTKEGFLRRCCIFYDCCTKYNIFKDELESIWHSDYICQARRSFKVNKSFDFCSGCPIGFGAPLF